MALRNRRPCAPAFLGALLIALSPLLAASQDEKPAAAKDEKKPAVGEWVASLESGVTLTQGSYSANWAGGDRGSVIWTAITNAGLQNQLNPKMNWNNTLKLAYGQTHQQTVNPDGTRVWDLPSKSTDLIDFETIMRFTLGGFVDPFTSGRIQSQFQDASDPSGRHLAFNPVQFSESAGIAKQFVNEKERSLLTRLGFTVRENSRRTFTDPAPSTRTTSEMTNDGGLEWVTDSKNTILQKRVTWTGKLTVYQPVFYSGKKVLKDLTPAQLEQAGIDPDVAKFSTALSTDLENIFTSQITKIISVTLYTRWVFDQYDNSVKPILAAGGGLENAPTVKVAVRKAGQFKETLSLGVTYRFL